MTRQDKRTTGKLAQPLAALVPEHPRASPPQTPLPADQRLHPGPRALGLPARGLAPIGHKRAQATKSAKAVFGS